MKKIYILIWVFLPLLAASLSYGQDTTNQVTGSMPGSSMSASMMSKEVMDKDKEIENVVRTENWDQYPSFLADDYRSIDESGIRNKDEQVSFMKNVKINSVQKSDEQVAFPSDNVAILTYKATYNRSVNGQDMSGTYNASTTFVKKNGQWQVAERVLVKAAR